MPNNNILITGSSGQLGKQFKLLDYKSNNKYFYMNRLNLDITKFDDLYKYIEHNDINIVINCAAFTKVDMAEKMSREAYLINQHGCKNLAKISSIKNIIIIQISTDYVFNSGTKTFLDETHPTNPTSEYGCSKLAGEKEFYNIEGSKFIIIRSGWLYSFHGNNFMNTIIKLLGKNEPIRVVSDQYGTPTSCIDLVLAIYKMLINDNFYSYAKAGSLYHFSNSGYCSWYEYALEIKKIINSKCEIVKINSRDYNSVANRPMNSILKVKKIVKDFGLDIPPWEISLRKVIERK